MIFTMPAVVWHQTWFGLGGMSRSQISPGNRVDRILKRDWRRCGLMSHGGGWWSDKPNRLGKAIGPLSAFHDSLIGLKCFCKENPYMYLGDFLTRVRTNSMCALWSCWIRAIGVSLRNPAPAAAVVESDHPAAGTGALSLNCICSNSWLYY